MARDLLFHIALLVAIGSPMHAGELVLVKDGAPRAEIVLAEPSPRTTRLAASELRAHVKKLSGATLPVVTAPGKAAVKVYVGRSPHTDRLGITTDDLKYGAYRIVSGDDWLVLIGDDTDFVPREPWARSHSHYLKHMLPAWDKLTGTTWGNPAMSRLYKHYTGRAFDFGKPGCERRDKNDTIHVWAFDERGSLNAVYGLLRRLGVRWYMPGPLGEVTPRRRTIALGKIDRTVKPDFPIRRFNFRFRIQPRDVALWAMRLGVRDAYGVWVPHGMARVTERDEMKKAHPEYYAVYNGKRATDRNQLCLSSEALVQENARFIRKVFDVYGFSAASVMPNDGFVVMCQCADCKGKDDPDREYRGRMSDYVWGYVNRVAREVAKTHPDKKIICCTYNLYKLPPVRIKKLEPNVIVCIVGGRRPRESKPEQRKAIRDLRRGWLAKTDNPIMIFENYPFTGRGWYLPSYLPHVIGESINAVKGISQGEDIWLTLGHTFEAPGYNHFNVYFTARMYWGGRRDVDAMFSEYCRLFYGPAEKQMKAFFEYCQGNWQEMVADTEKIDRALGLFAAARKQASADGVYGRRIALVADYLEALKNRRAQLAKPRGKVPELRMARDAAGIRIDGKLDDKYWLKCPVRSTRTLRMLQTGRKATLKTVFKVAWGREGLYFAIRCEDEGKPTIATRRNDDPAIWYGDVVEILLETESHSYYQIAINPAGAVADMDRRAPKDRRMRWDSQAEVAATVDDGGWSVEARIPVVPKTSDPLHQVVGRKPTSSLPWYFNVCRQRIRGKTAEHFAFSPTGKKTFHDVLKFAKLYGR